MWELPTIGEACDVASYPPNAWLAKSQPLQFLAVQPFSISNWLENPT
jgi:hypothetical protein